MDLPRSAARGSPSASRLRLLKVAAALELQRAHHLAPFTDGQMNYSLLGRDVERDVIPMMRRYGLGLTVWSPLASGFLSGKYTRENLSDPNNRFSGFDILPFDKEKAFALVDQLRQLATQHRASVAQTHSRGSSPKTLSAA